MAGVPKLFVANLPASVTETELQHHFSQFGEVTDAHLARDNKTNQVQNFGYVTFVDPKSVETALSRTNTLKGRLLSLRRFEQKPSRYNYISCNASAYKASN